MPSTYSELEWETHRDLLWRLWVKEKKKLPDVVKTMAALGFEPSQREILSHFKSWNFAKNQPNETWKYAGLAIEKRKRDSKDSIVIVDGVVVPPKRLKHETSRHFYTQVEKATNPSPSPPAGTMTTVCTPPAMEFELEWPQVLPFLRVKSRLSGLFPISSTGVPSSLTKAQHQLSTTMAEGPLLDLLQTSGWLESARSLSATQLSTCFGAWIPEAFPGEHTLQSQRIIKNQCPDPWMTYLHLTVYVVSNNFLHGRSEATIFHPFLESGILNQTIPDQHPLLEEPAIRAFLGKMFRYAIDDGHKKALRWLLRLNVKLSVHLPLSMALDSFSFKPDLLEEVLSSGADPNEYCCRDHVTPVDFAAYTRKFHALQMFVEHQKASTSRQASINPAHGASSSKSISSQDITLVEILAAVYDGDIPRLEKLHCQGTNFNMRNRWGMCALGEAVTTKAPHSLDVTKALLQMGASPNFDPSPQDHGDLPSALHGAARIGDLQICRLLLEHGAAIDKLARSEHPTASVPPWEPRGYLTTPAGLAIHHKFWDCAEFLLFHEAAVGTGRIYNDENSLHKCLLSGAFSTARVLLDLGVQLDGRALKSIYPCNTLVEYEVMQGLEKAWATESLDSLDNIIRSNSLPHAFSGAFIVEIGAKKLNQFSIVDVKWMLEDLTLRFQFYTAALKLVRAIFPGAYCSEMTLALMQSLYIAKTGSVPSGIEALKEHLILKESASENEALDHALEEIAVLSSIHFAARCGHFEPMKLLFGKAQMAMASPWQNPFVPVFTPLDNDNLLYHPIGGFYNFMDPVWREDCAQALIEANCLPNTAGGLVAVCAESVAEVEQLRSWGFNPRRRYPWSSTALQYAVEDEQEDMVRFLLKLGVSVNACPPWMQLSDGQEYDCPNQIRVDRKYREARTALQHATQSGNLELVDLLLAHGADINGPPASYRGATALQLTAIQGSIGLTKKLIDLGADVNGARARWYGRTALEGAAEHGRLDTVALLLEEGCNIYGKGREQHIRAVKLARDNGHVEMASMLEKLGAWTKKDEQGLSSCEIDEEEEGYEDPHKWCYGEFCDECLSVDEGEVEPRCWESGSEVSEDDFTSLDEEYSTQESLNEEETVEEGQQRIKVTEGQAVQHNIGESTEGALVDGADSIVPFSAWVKEIFDD